MPELPEVEVTRMGLAPFVEGKVLRKAVIRVKRLRSPVGELAQKLDAKTVLQLSRRGKYLVWHFVDAQGVKGWLVTHLGMSGYWRVWQLPAPEPGVHEHVDFVFDDCLVRLTDVRRFGDMCWFDDDPFGQKPLADLGWEPFDANVAAEMFARAMRAKRRPVKEVLMAGDVVVGCGILPEFTRQEQQAAFQKKGSRRFLAPYRAFCRKPLMPAVQRCATFMELTALTATLRCAPMSMAGRVSLAASAALPSRELCRPAAARFIVQNAKNKKRIQASRVQAQWPLAGSV